MAAVRIRRDTTRFEFPPLVSSGSFCFSRVVQTPIAWLRAKGFRVHAYLDDLLVLAHSPAQLTRHLVYFGDLLRLDLGRVLLPVERREALIMAVRSSARIEVYHTAKCWL